MKKFTLLLVVTMLGIPLVANAVTFSKDVTSCVDIWADTLSDGSAVIHFKGTDPNVISHYASGLSEYAPDEEADGAVDKWYEKGSLFQGDPNHAIVLITKQSLALGLRGFNNIDCNGAWGPFPHPYVRIHFGANLIYQRSIDPSGRGSEDGKGGGHVTFIGDLSPEQASRFVSVPYRGGYACGQVGIGVKPEPRPARPHHPRKDVKMKRVPCPSGKGICEEPCIEEIKADVREIKTDVKEIKVDVKEIKTDVRATKESVGEATPEEKREGLGTLQKKTSKSLSEHKETQRRLGKSKRKNGTITGIVEQNHRILRKNSQDLDDIKEHFKIPKTELKDCSKCHNDLDK